MDTFQHRSRLVVVLAAGLVILVAGVSSGSPGDPLILGQANDAGTTDTSLSSSSGGNAFAVTQSGTGTGVYGEGGTYGVYGYSTSAMGYGVYGGNLSTGRGVSGTSISGTGVHAEAGVNGFALRVVGRAVFNKSGLLTIPAGASSATKTGIGPLNSGSLVLAVLQQNASGRFVRAVVPDVAAGSFTVFLNRAVNSNTTVAWFIVDSCFAC